MSFLKSRIALAAAHPVSESLKRYKNFGLMFPACYDIGKNILLLKKDLYELQIKYNSKVSDVIDFRNLNFDSAMSFLESNVFDNEFVKTFYREDSLSKDKIYLYEASAENIDQENIWQIKNNIRKNYSGLNSHFENLLCSKDYLQIKESKEGMAVAKLLENTIKEIGAGVD